MTDGLRSVARPREEKIMAVELYNDGKHACIGFYDLMDEGGDAAIQCNQFLVVDGGKAALIDPGGSLTYSSLLVEIQKHVALKDLAYILASHADPDVIASVNKWFVASRSDVVISRLWARFVPHFTTGRIDVERIVALPDEGAVIPLGGATITALPAHFLHSEGNFQFYDPIAKILFSGDLGASLVPQNLAAEPVRDFDAHLRFMLGFHRRYMGSNRVCRFWANMVRQLDIQMIVPQHGSRFVGREMVGRFIDWVENLSCGVDVMAQDNYRIP
jgi:flavorubredoxin